MSDEVKQDFVPGVYFGMSEDDYHAIEAFSSSGAKNILISTMDFWANSWLNPNKPNEPDKKHFLDGKGYHARILEGEKAFNKRYVSAFEPADYPEALNKTEDLKNWLRTAKDNNHTVKLTGTKPELTKQILDIDPSVQIMEVLKSEYGRANAGRSFIDSVTVAQIELAAAMINKHPELSRCFIGGYPEVSILWFDDVYGLPMKARIDYLKIRAIVDLKTFANSSGKPIDSAIYSEIANRKYHISVAFYHLAVDVARGLVSQGHVFGECDPEWLEKFAIASDNKFVLVFQQKGIAPVARGKIFPKGLVYGCGVAAVCDAMKKYSECMETFGSSPWVDVCAIEKLEDEGFPIYITEV